MSKIPIIEANSNHFIIPIITAKESKDMTKNLHRLMAQALRRFRLVSDLKKMRKVKYV